mgnify:CR=1 FL=1|tara:strand:+ start:1092 stop:1421 length:330 start_codon:yes stop_codon:yes gene_type:complete
MKYDSDFDYEGVYWRRMNGITSPPPIINKELYDDSNEDPYSKLNFYSEKNEYTIEFYNYLKEKTEMDKNKYLNDFYYFKIPSCICEYMYCNRINNVVKKTFIVFAGYVF